MPCEAEWQAGLRNMQHIREYKGNQYAHPHTAAEETMNLADLLSLALNGKDDV